MGKRLLLSVVVSTLLATGCESVTSTGAEPSDEASAPIREKTTAPEGMLEACRAARNMLDANVTAGMTSEFGEDERLRAIAADAAAEFFTVANRVDDAEFSDWASTMRLVITEMRQDLRVSDETGEYPRTPEEIQARTERLNEAADGIYERCLEVTRINIRQSGEVQKERRE